MGLLSSENSTTNPAGKTNADWPRVSVLVPAFNEAQYIDGCLESLLAQDYPRDRFEILVLDGSSTDATPQLVRKIQERSNQVRYVHNPGMLASSALNVGIRVAAGEIVIRMDAHARAPQDYLSKVVGHLLEKEVDHVGVRQHPVGQGFWGECIASGMSSPFGVGGSKHICSTLDGWDEPGWLGGFWKERALGYGEFDESLGPNEDDEFFSRIQKAGGRLYRTAQVEITYYCRSSLTKLWVQFFRYGFYKPPVIWKHGLARIRHFAPPLFVALFSFLAVSTLSSPLAALLFFALATIYACSAVVFAWRAARTVRWRVALALPVVFAVLHFSYGSGFLSGMAYWGVRSFLRIFSPSRADR